MNQEKGKIPIKLSLDGSECKEGSSSNGDGKAKFTKCLPKGNPKNSTLQSFIDLTEKSLKKSNYGKMFKRRGTGLR